MSNSSELIEILKEERKKLEISKYKLGKESDVSHTTIARVENGEVIPSLDTFVKLAEALGYDLELIKKSESSVSISKQTETSRKYCAQLYEQENKDIDRAIETLKRIRKK